MSTKATIVHGNSWHVYRELNEDGNPVYLDIEVEYALHRDKGGDTYPVLVSRQRVIVQLPPDLTCLLERAAKNNRTKKEK